MERDIKRVKGLALFGFCALAGVVLGGSVAYACTTWVGQMEVTGNGPGSGTVTTVGANRGGVMTYCPSRLSSPPSLIALDGGWPNGRARIARTGTRTLTIAVRAGTMLCPASTAGSNATNNGANAFPASDYWVTYKLTGLGDSYYGVDEDGFRWTRMSKVDCMKSAAGPTSGGGKTFDTSNLKLTVNSTGYGSEVFTASDTWSFGNIEGVDEALVCVSGLATSTGGVTTQWGNQAPFFII